MNELKGKSKITRCTARFFKPPLAFNNNRRTERMTPRSGCKVPKPIPRAFPYVINQERFAKNIPRWLISSANKPHPVSTQTVTFLSALIPIAPWRTYTDPFCQDCDIEQGGVWASRRSYLLLGSR